MQRNSIGRVLLLLALVLAVSFVTACTQPAAQPAATPAAPSTSATTATPAAAAPKPTQPAAATAQSTQPAAAAPKPTQPAAQKLIPMKVAWTIASASAPVIVAQEKGYYKEQGLDVQLETFKSAQDSMALLGSGEIQAVAGSINAGAMNMLHDGLTLKIVLPMTYVSKDYPALSLLVRKDLIDSGKVKTVSDLKGMKLAASGKGVNSEYFLEKALETGGLTLDDVDVMYMGFPDMIVGLTNKGLDAAQSLGPFDTKAERMGIGKVLLRNIGLDYMNLVVFYGGKFIKEQPDAGRKFAVAYLKAMRDIAGKNFFNDDILKIVAKATNSTEADLRDSQLYYFDPNIQMSPAGLMEQQNLWLKRGYLTYKEPIDLTGLIDTQFADYALKELGPYKP